MNRYKAYIFDFDYTLVDSSLGIVTCFQYALKNAGFSNISDNDIKKTIGKSLEISFSELTHLTDSTKIEHLRKEYILKANECMTNLTFFFPEVKYVLKKLRLEGAKLAIVSNKFKFRIIEFLQKEQMIDIFDSIVGLEDVTNHKPSPDGIYKSINELKVPKEEVLYLGDSVIDAQTAQSSAVNFWAILHGITSKEEITLYQHVGVSETLDAILYL
ncbi:HAD family hydrolase [Rhizosphaericola mali]|uniref:phosphoglycolate phosphatase n=1 Tax=Rhizosphaericola mali TaxID=2545455 RepID=A0A5P2G0L1_9BACT|nr:HAD-IA family hydrolase [Rhizosphaericola mali]QES88717.1 HAD-IA family hydrolase [Rhizosphaericola mali]